MIILLFSLFIFGCGGNDEESEKEVDCTSQWVKGLNNTKYLGGGIFENSLTGNSCAFTGDFIVSSGAKIKMKIQPYGSLFDLCSEWDIDYSGESVCSFNYLISDEYLIYNGGEYNRYVDLYASKTGSGNNINIEVSGVIYEVDNNGNKTVLARMYFETN